MAIKKSSPKPMDKFVGQRVRMARLMKTMSQERLADQLGITFQQVQKYEKGTNRIGSSRLADIARIVGQPVSWFFDEQPDGKPSVRLQDTDLVTRMMALPHGINLAKSFCAIKHNHKRAVLAEVAAEMAG